ncbi:MAG TPA: hypothetical protein VGN37_20290 [Actinocatenispora sp.]
MTAPVPAGWARVRDGLALAADASAAVDEAMSDPGGYLPAPWSVADPSDVRFGAGARAVALLAAHGGTDPDVLAAATLLPWYGGVAGRPLTDRPVVRWASLLAASARSADEWRTGPVSAGWLAEQPAAVRALAVAGWLVGGGEPADRATVDRVARGLPDTLRAEAARAARDGRPGDAGSGPVPDEAAARRLVDAAGPGVAGEVAEVGPALWYAVRAAASTAFGPLTRASGTAPAPEPPPVLGSRQPPVSEPDVGWLVDRLTGTVRTAILPVPDDLPARLVPVPPGWTVRPRPAPVDALAATSASWLTWDGGARIRAATVRAWPELVTGGGWLPYLWAWHVGQASVDLLDRLGEPDPALRTAVLLVAAGPVDEHPLVSAGPAGRPGVPVVSGLSPAAVALAAQAIQLPPRPTPPPWAAGHPTPPAVGAAAPPAAYVPPPDRRPVLDTGPDRLAHLSRQPSAVRRVALVAALARAGVDRRLFPTDPPVRTAELDALRPLAADQPDLAAAYAG